MTQAERGAEKAYTILKAIKEFYDGGSQAVYAGSLLFEDDDSLQTHIEDAIHDLEALPDPD